MALHNGTLDSLTDEMFFLLVRNNVHGDSVVYGSGIGLEKGVYSKYDSFCAYAYKQNGTIRAHDIAVNYGYQDTYTAWWTDIKAKTFDNVTIVTDVVIYREGDHHLPEVESSYPVAEVSDGHWTVPYYDCGDGNVWMVTYVAPLLKVVNGSILFQGIASIDIELTHIDINQCDDYENSMSSGLDVFRGTHRCQSTTTCIPMKGEGFVTGAYTCECNDGFYFPSKLNGTRAYTGKEMDNYVRQFGVIKPGMFQCVACATGCDTCVDSSPCLHEHNYPLKIALLIATISTVLGIGGIAVITYVYRNNKIIKSASPMFLELMCVGGILLCSQFFTTYFKTTVLMCTVRIWPHHIGFYILYGSLVVKTWRIAAIFTVGARKRLHLPDQALLQRLGILMCFVVLGLVAWTAGKPPEIAKLKTSEGLHFYLCEYGPLEYAVIATEILLLMYGVYLCFLTRKVPAQFNDKFMTYAIYNAIILGIFMTFMSRLLISVIGPDLSLVFQFLQLQVFASVTLLIIFVPKFLAVKKKKETNGMNNTLSSQTSNSIKKGRFNKGFSGVIDLNVNFLKFLEETMDKSTQTDGYLDRQNIHTHLPKF
ncbi:probable G-protein coupled receptor 179 isoform X2 [Mercenaria mercenaria]|nr:probable G-protein coupled receptor 179 isoform X2 [Mercenaria mercenaria]